MVFTLVIGAFLALLFAISGVHKLLHFAEFSSAVADYEVMPKSLAPLAAAALIALEIAVPALLYFAWRLGFTVSVGLLCLYAAGIAFNLKRGRRHIDCGCYMPGAARNTIGWGLVIRNLSLSAIALSSVLLIDFTSLRFSGHWLEMVSIGMSVAVLAGVYLAIDHAIQFRTRRAN